MARAKPVPPRRTAQGDGGSGAKAGVGTAIVLLLLFALGGAIGLVGSRFFGGAGVFGSARVRAALHEDTAQSLERTCDLAEGDRDLAPLAALARALLASEHDGGARDQRAAEELVKAATGSGAQAPETLYARAVLRTLGTPDAALDADLEKAAEAAGASPPPLLQLARGRLLLLAGRSDDAMPFVRAAALRAGAPAHAQLMLARVLAARGERDEALAVLERLWRTHPVPHPTSRALAIALAVLDSAQRPEQATKLTAAETDALGVLDQLAPRDAAQLAAALGVVAAGRHDSGQGRDLRQRSHDVASAFPAAAARQIDLALLDGDLASAEETWKLATKEVAPAEPLLLAARSRMNALKLVPQGELAQKSKAARDRGPAVNAAGFEMAAGAIVLDPLVPGVPARFVWHREVPEQAIRAALEANAPELDRRLKLVDAIAAAEYAVAHGDITAASAAVTTASGFGQNDADVRLLEARVRLRQGDKVGARQSLDAAIAAAPEEPRVLLRAAELAIDAERTGISSKALAKLKTLGIVSPSALAIEVLLGARPSPGKGELSALARAKQLAPDEPLTLAATVLVARLQGDAVTVRAAADRLAGVSDGKSGDPIVRAWIAEAIARRGEGLRAEGIVDELLLQKQAVADATFAKAVAKLSSDPAASGALFARAAQLGQGTFIAEEAKARAP